MRDRRKRENTSERAAALSRAIGALERDRTQLLEEVAQLKATVRFWATVSQHARIAAHLAHAD